MKKFLLVVASMFALSALAADVTPTAQPTVKVAKVQTVKAKKAKAPKAKQAVAAKKTS